MTHYLEEKMISEFINTLGPWSRYVIVGGGFALFIYKMYFAGSEAVNHPVGTHDIDSLLPRIVSPVSEKSIAEHLTEAGFVHQFKDMNIPATESYIKEVNGVEMEVEFLTDKSTRGDKNKNVKIAGIVAQPLKFLNLSLQSPLEFRTNAGEKGKVVAPESWIFHKGLTFTRRKSRPKMLKDLYGIWYVSSQLGKFSARSKDEFAVLKANFPKWALTFKNQLLTWINEASPNDWSNLESQDPSGQLNRLGFKREILQLIDQSL